MYSSLYIVKIEFYNIRHWDTLIRRGWEARLGLLTQQRPRRKTEVKVCRKRISPQQTCGP